MTKRLTIRMLESQVQRFQIHAEPSKYFRQTWIVSQISDRSYLIQSDGIEAICTYRGKSLAVDVLSINSSYEFPDFSHVADFRQSTD